MCIRDRLRAALQRRLDDECAILFGYDTGSIFWDLAKFYDTIDWCRMIQWSLDLGFPPRVLEIMFSLHSAPRVLRVGKVCSKSITPHNSVVAGCCSAIWLSRVMVCTILDRTHQLGPQRSRNFYDDIVSRATGDHQRVVEGLGSHGVVLAGQIAAARLDVNTCLLYTSPSPRDS